MGIVGPPQRDNRRNNDNNGYRGNYSSRNDGAEIALNHVLTLLSVRITSNQSLAFVQDPPNVALKKKMCRDLILQSTTGRLTMVVVAVEVAVLAEVEVLIRKGL